MLTNVENLLKNTGFLDLVHSLPSWLVWAEIENTVHVHKILETSSLFSKTGTRILLYRKYFLKLKRQVFCMKLHNRRYSTNLQIHQFFQGFSMANKEICSLFCNFQLFPQKYQNEKPWLKIQIIVFQVRKRSVVCLEDST